MIKPFLSLEIGPNFQQDDAKIAFKSLNSRDQEFFGNAEYEVQQWFLNNLGSKPWLTDTCRGGIYLLLESLNLPENSEVLIQAFSCIVVPNAVFKAKLKPIACDINPKNYNFDWKKIEENITKKTKVLIVQHNFGIMADMEKAFEICKKYKLILIEDAAHSLGGSYTIEGKTYKAGTFGHLASFSFGRDKVISTTTGGASQINHNSPIFKSIPVDIKSFTSEFEKNYSRLAQMPDQKVRQNLLYPILTAVFIKPIYQLVIGKIIALIARKLKATGDVYTEYEKSGNILNFSEPKKFSSNLYPLLLNQLNKLDKLNQHRQKIAKIYSKELGIRFNSDNVYLRFAINLNELSKKNTESEISDKYFKIKHTARKAGYYLGIWYTRLFLGANSNYPQFDNTNLKTASQLISHKVLNLPTHINTTEADALKIVKIVKDNL